jgi:membrane protease YdiL (CAAX protease family)
MHFIADPSGVRPGVAAIMFLLAMCVLLPFGAIRQNRRLARDEDLARKLSRSRIYGSAIATHAVLLVLAWTVVREQRLDLFPDFRPAAMHAIIALVAFGLGLLPALERFRLRDPVADERTRLIAPRTRREQALFVGVAISAGFSEQTAYRGVLFILLAALFDSWWGAAVAAAAAFGVAHFFQGWKSAAVAALVGLRDQVVVGLTGTLVYAMVIHALHDLVMGAVIAMRVRREDAASGAALAPS